MHADRDLVLDGGVQESVGCARRDPCVDPQPGDVLAVGTDVREVLDRVGDRVEYGFPRRAASRWLPLIRWQVWARNADAHKVAR